MAATLFKVGDRVKLTDTVAAARMRKVTTPWYHPRPSKTVDWAARRGTVVSMPKFAGKGSAMVQWDGTKYGDQWPVTALEIAA